MKLKLLSNSLKIFFSIHFLMSFVLQAQINVPGGNVSGIWTKTDSPYNITGDVTIPTGDTLIIEAGVKIEFQGYYKMQVNGTLLAPGNQADSILFTVSDTTGFYNNSDSNGGWAGLRFSKSSSSICIFSYCIFEYGKATIINNESGGVIYLKGSQRRFIISNCVFRNNKASAHGGSIYSESDGIIGGSIILDSCLFIGNTAKYGGGAEIWSYNDINSMTNCRFIWNKAESGGGLKLETAFRTFNNNLFFENEATENGGGIYLGGSTAQRVENCIIVRNFAPHGAGISCYMGGYNDIINTTIVNNNSDHSIIYLGDWTFTEIYNSIIWNPSNNEIEQAFTDGSLTIKYSDIKGGKDSSWFGEGCIDSLPLFSYSWNMDFQLDRNSPCIDKGSNEYVNCPADFYGNLRKINAAGLDSAVVDMGAIEFHVNNSPNIISIPDQRILPSNRITIPLYFTDEDTSDTHIITVESDTPNVLIENISGNTSGSTFDLVAEDDWTGSTIITVFVSDNSGQSNAMDSVQFNLIVSDEVCGHINKNTRWDIDTVKVTCNIVVDPDATLYVDPGTVVEFQGSYKLVIYGILKACGLPGDSVYFTIDEKKANIGWKGIEFLDKILVNDTSKIEYCVIEKVKNSGPVESYPRGAISIINYDRILISYSTIIDNNAIYGSGGGIYCSLSSPEIKNNLILNNHVIGYGGGLYFKNSSPLIQNNYIAGNTCAEGGGICLQESSAVIINNEINGNEAYQGGGISAQQSNNVRIIGNVLSGNRTSNCAGGIQFDNTRGLIINNTIYGNRGADYAGGILIGKSNAFLINNIIRDNLAGSYCNEIYVSGCDTMLDIIHCNIKNGLNDIFTGNNPDSVPGLFLNIIDSDPMFAYPDNQDFRLEPESPCRNNGYYDTSGLNLPDLDIYGNPRIFEDIIDIGAAECMGQPVKDRSIFLEKTDVKCFGENNGSVDLHIYYGTEPYNYNWSIGDTTEDISGLSPGLYYVTVTDANDSTVTDSVQIFEPDPLVSEIKDIKSPSYYGFSDAKAKVTVLGGSPPYYYLWDDPDSTRESEANSLKGDTKYHVQISDRRGCITSDSLLTFESDHLYIEFSVINDLTCKGDTDGIVIAFPYYAEEPLTWLWDDPANSTDSIIKNISANKVYHVLITDKIGNTGYDSIQLTDPDPIHIDSILIEDVEPCFGDTNGSITVIANMGAGSLQYSIDDGITFLKDWYFNNLSAGEYSMVIKDTSNCLLILDNLIIHQPEKIQSGLITGDDQVIQDETVTYSTISKLGSAYEWFITGGNLINGQGTDLVNVQWASEGSGKISFLETDSNGCVSDTASMVVEIYTGYFSHNIEQIRIYPNPFSGKAIVQLPNSRNYYDLVITDLAGKVIRRIGRITGNSYELDRGNLPSGLYIIELRGNDIYRGKIIIE